MIAEDDTWLAKAGLHGEPEAALVSGFCVVGKPNTATGTAPGTLHAFSLRCRFRPGRAIRLRLRP
jgi:hypothetical protein